METTPIKRAYIENQSLDDLLEILEDWECLSEKWKILRKKVWEETEEWKWFIDSYEKTWESFTDWEKEFLKKQAREWILNNRATEFILTIEPNR